MMTPNHALAGLLLGYTAVLWRPELLVIAAVAGWGGGLIPDLDTVFEHRKTLHFPVYYPLLALAAFVTAFQFGSITAFIAAYLFSAAALHCVTDYFVAIQKASDDESPEGVLYVHPLKRWVGPVPLIPYAGAPTDLLVGYVIGMPLLFLYSGLLRWITLLTLIASTGYAVHRLQSNS